MFRPESWQSHNEYRNIIKTYGRRLSRNHQKYSFGSYEEESQKLLNLNLDPVTGFIRNLYSGTGRPAKNQAQILRSLILFVLLFNKTKAKTSLTAWVRDILPESPSLIILTGCTDKDGLPPLGSYYDFMNRLWAASRSIYSRNALSPPSRKPKKEIGADGKLVEQDEYYTQEQTFLSKNHFCQGLFPMPFFRLSTVNFSKNFIFFPLLYQQKFNNSNFAHRF